MGDVIAPRRDEAIIDETGRPNLRFFQYLELSAEQVNNTVPDTEIDSSSINLSVGQAAALSKRILELEILSGIVPATADLQDIIASVENIKIDVNGNVSAILAKLQNQINDLRTLVT